MTKRSNKAKADICQTITDNIIESLEAGVLPWRQPWDGVTETGLPSNASTGRAYSGINIVRLWVSQIANGYTSNRWLTFKQAKALSGTVRKGEKGTLCVFYKSIEVDSKTRVDSNGDPEKDIIPLLRTFYVFNLDQIDGLDELKTDANRVKHDFTPDAAGEELYALAKTHLASITDGGTKACYIPSKDAILMPDRDRFENPADYYATFAHEFAHATAHKSRCDRKPYSDDYKTAYAFEELVAELGSLFIAAHIGMNEPMAGHDSYIASWLKDLKNDKRYILKAAAQAQKATDWVLEAWAAYHDQSAAA